jgi:hypothetical protein
VEEAFIVYNQHTQDDRATVEEAFSDIVSRFAVAVNPSGVYTIEPLRFQNLIQ